MSSIYQSLTRQFRSLQGARVMTTALSVVAMLLGLNGCASYTTPGAGVQLTQLADADINELMAKQPAAKFPARIAFTRLQASGYSAYGTESYGNGAFSVVTAREMENEADFMKLGQMEGVAGVAPLNRILLPAQLLSIKDLRLAAARLQTDMLLVYTFDTSFHVGSQHFAPLNAIALGFLENKEVTVTTTASAALFDVRTEFLYGVAESTAQQSGMSSLWSEESEVDDLRKKAEQAAFKSLVPEMAKTWQRLVKQYQVKPPLAAAPQ